MKFKIKSFNYLFYKIDLIEVYNFSNNYKLNINERVILTRYKLI
jgi:hypothetical protein